MLLFSISDVGIKGSGPVEAEGRQIERRVAAMDYQLAEAASYRRRLLS
jgi:hypothetical protein